MLYVVATPIGNMDDISKRALQTLFSSDVILCEDTRKTTNLLNHYKKDNQKLPPVFAYFEENELEKIPKIIESLKIGETISLVTNAGTPAISDPGFKLIRECIKEKIKVIGIPGASSVSLAISISGLPTDKFTFIGFPPNKSGQRQKLFEQIKKSQENLSSTVIFFESPFRIKESLIDLKQIFGDIEIVICRELTKIYEETLFAKISFFEEKFNIPPKGELVVLFNLKAQVL